MNENDVLRDVAGRYRIAGNFTTVGIGDDAAVVKPSEGEQLVITSDALAENVHFDLLQHTYEQVAYKAIAVNLSDLAAMGAKPRAAILTVFLPSDAESRAIDSMLAKIGELAQQYQFEVIGGDTNIYQGPLIVSVTMVGSLMTPEPILRSGARPGDLVLVTGALGGSRAGRHLSFQPRLAEAEVLVSRYEVTAMMDVSDGLASDLRKLATSSKAQITIDAAAVPIHDDLKQTEGHKLWLERALCDGEDFELCFTMPEHAAKKLLSSGLGVVPVQVIGRVDVGEGVWLKPIEGPSQPLMWHGYQHGVC